MLPDDLTLEVRDRTLARLGTIPPRDLIGEFRIVDSAVGDWSLTLPADHEMGPALRTPGAGIILTGPAGVICSGPMTSAKVTVDQDGGAGTLTVAGVTDEIVLWDTLAWPDPTFDFDLGDFTMDVAYDVWTGDLSTLTGALDALAYFLDPNLARWPAGTLGSFVSLVNLTGSNLIPNPDPQPDDLSLPNSTENISGIWYVYPDKEWVDGVYQDAPLFEWWTNSHKTNQTTGEDIGTESFITAEAGPGPAVAPDLRSFISRSDRLGDDLWIDAIFPVRDLIPIIEGGTLYRVSCQTYSDVRNEAGTSLSSAQQIAVRWYDAAHVVISTDYSDTFHQPPWSSTVAAPDPETWPEAAAAYTTWERDPRWGPGPFNAYTISHDLTAPAGAAFAEPLVHSAVTNGHSQVFAVADFYLGQVVL